MGAQPDIEGGKKHMFSSATNFIVETQLFDTPSEPELKFLKALQNHGLSFLKWKLRIVNRYDPSW